MKTRQVSDVAADAPAPATGSAESGEFASLFMDFNEFALESVESTSSSSRRIISFGVDSCAAASGIPLDTCSDYPLIPSANPETFRSATGQTVKERGTRRILGTVDGSMRAVKAKVLNIRRPLISVFDMVKANHKVTFDQVDGVDVSKAVNKTTGEVSRFVLRNRCWDLDVEVVPPNKQAAATERRKQEILMMAPFSRQAAQQA